jgi:hypothetical protein
MFTENWFIPIKYNQLRIIYPYFLMDFYPLTPTGGKYYSANKNRLGFFKVKCAASVSEEKI